MKIAIAILTVVLCLLIGWTYRIEEVHLQKGKSASVDKWSQTELKSIHYIQLKRDSQQLEFKKNQFGIWMMTKPDFTMADQLKIHQWLTTVLRPKIRRVLPWKERYLSHVHEGVELFISFNEKSLNAILFHLPENTSDRYLYFPKEKLVYRIFSEIALDFEIIAQRYWTKRIFPFSLVDVKEMQYRYKDRVVRFENANGKWSVLGGEQIDWSKVLSQFSQASSIEFINAKLLGRVISQYELLFLDGHRAKMELLMTNEGHVLYYEGRSIGQKIDSEVVSFFFPKLRP